MPDCNAALTFNNYEGRYVMGFQMIADWLKTLGLILGIIFVMGWMQARDELDNMDNDRRAYHARAAN